MSYIVADEYDWTGPYKNRTDATKECKRWRLEGRNAEVIRRLPKHLAGRGKAIMPRFYPRSDEQVRNHAEPIGGDVEDSGYLRWYERSLGDWDAPTYEQPKLRGWLEREPSLKQSDGDELAMSPQDLWMEHRGWSA